MLFIHVIETGIISRTQPTKVISHRLIKVSHFMYIHLEREKSWIFFITENSKQKMNNSQDGQLFCITNIKNVMDLVGYGEKDNPNFTVEELLHDAKRVEYMADYLDALLRAVR